MGRGRALLAGAILTTSTLYALMAQVLTTDMLLAAAVTVALFALYLHWSEGGRWCWLGYAAIAMGLLTKGPVAAAIPIITLAIFLWWQGDWRGAIGRFHALAGGAMVMLIGAPWFIAIAVREPGFVDFYFVGEHLRRFFESSYSHGEPFYYYLPVLAAGMMPWTLMTPFIVKKGERVRVRLGNLSMDSHPIHLHGYRFEVTGTEGGPIPPSARFRETTVDVLEGLAGCVRDRNAARAQTAPD